MRNASGLVTLVEDFSTMFPRATTEEIAHLVVVYLNNGPRWPAPFQPLFRGYPIEWRPKNGVGVRITDRIVLEIGD